MAEYEDYGQDDGTQTYYAQNPQFILQSHNKLLTLANPRADLSNIRLDVIVLNPNNQTAGLCTQALRRGIQLFRRSFEGNLAFGIELSVTYPSLPTVLSRTDQQHTTVANIRTAMRGAHVGEIAENSIYSPFVNVNPVNPFDYQLIRSHYDDMSCLDRLYGYIVIADRDITPNEQALEEEFMNSDSRMNCNSPFVHIWINLNNTQRCTCRVIEA